MNPDNCRGVLYALPRLTGYRLPRNEKPMIKYPLFSKSSSVLVLVAGTAIACAGADAQTPEEIDAGRDANPVAQTQSAEISCEMAFTMSGWSAIVSKSEGEGVVTCDNGQREAVSLEITGGGLTFGQTSIDEGKGVFSHVADIAEVFGSYAQAEVSAGAVDAVGAQAMTKGDVSLAITTKGSGWSLGVSGAKFSITHRVVTANADDGS
jgi:hypothetical protein